MKNGKTEHFGRIHKRVMLRVRGELSDETRDLITTDELHTTEAYKWFESKVLADATRLYEDPDYYANDKYSFRFPKEQW